jgi:hypothetical protein
MPYVPVGLGDWLEAQKHSLSSKKGKCRTTDWASTGMKEVVSTNNKANKQTNKQTNDKILNGLNLQQQRASKIYL